MDIRNREDVHHYHQIRCSVNQADHPTRRSHWRIDSELKEDSYAPMAYVGAAIVCGTGKTRQSRPEYNKIRVWYASCGVTDDASCATGRGLVG